MRSDKAILILFCFSIMDSEEVQTTGELLRRAMAQLDRFSDTRNSNFKLLSTFTSKFIYKILDAFAYTVQNRKKLTYYAKAYTFLSTAVVKA